MMDNNLLITVFGSAAVGALVSSAFSELGRWRERISRREELALTKAVDMAHEHARLVIDTEGSRVPPDVLMLEDYYISIKHVSDHGKLDPDMRSRVSKQMAKHGVD